MIERSASSIVVSRGSEMVRKIVRAEAGEGAGAARLGHHLPRLLAAEGGGLWPRSKIINI